MAHGRRGYGGAAVTPIEYATNMDELLRYVGSLLVCDSTSMEWQIGRNFALISDSERFRYVRDLLESAPPKSRTREIAWDLRAIILGWPESGVAA